ncbi:hypothetical protein V8E51_001171 [Hyaloscypha variabilis]
MVRDLVPALDGAIDNCIKLANKAVKTYQAFRGADEAIEEKLVLISDHWGKIRVKLIVLNKISDQLGDDILQSQFNLLHRLEGKFLKAKALMDTLQPKGRSSKKSAQDVLRKLKYSMILKDSLDELLTDLDDWQSKFDPTWYLAVLMGGIVIDPPLEELRKEQQTTTNDVKDTLRSVLALRQAFNPNIRTAENDPDVKASVNRNKAGLEGAIQTLIPFSAARTILRKESSKLLLAETVDHLSRDISQVREDVEDLARKLMQVDPDAFGLLRCHGVLRNLDTSGQLSSIDILYQTPKDSTQPTSLRELLLDQKPVSVSAIMRLVKQLVRSVSYIHACNFVHKNIRPENIIVFPGPNSSLGSTFLLGFSHFRNTNFQTNLIGDPAWHRNLYRHPQRQGTLVQDRYVMQHDIYSLGVCLLEIGLWKPFVWYPISGEHGEPVPGLVLEFKLSDTQFATVGSAASLGIKEHLVELAKNNLPSRLGDMYTEIVLACLNCLDPENEEFGSVKDLVDGDGITVGVRFIEKVLIRINEITV